MRKPIMTAQQMIEDQREATPQCSRGHCCQCPFNQDFDCQALYEQEELEDERYMLEVSYFYAGYDRDRDDISWFDADDNYESELAWDAFQARQESEEALEGKYF